MEYAFKRGGNNCTPHNINIRMEEARFKREEERIEKNQRQLERHHKITQRRHTVIQRGIISLLGNDVYLDPGVKNEAFLNNNQNIPGFCYRRNGDARRPCSIYESKTSRVIHTLDGKEDIMEEHAANVVSDNPLMGEILSSPEILPILCDLRTTALLRSNKNLLFQFVKGLTQSVANGNPFNLSENLNQNPAILLKRYRAVLIQELFDALQIQAELRFNPGLTDELRGLGNVNQLVEKKSQTMPTAANVDPTLGTTFEDWNNALITRLNQVAAQKLIVDGDDEIAAVPILSSETNQNKVINQIPPAREHLDNFGIRGIVPLKTVSPSVFGFVHTNRIPTPNIILTETEKPSSVSQIGSIVSSLPLTPLSPPLTPKCMAGHISKKLKASMIELEVKQREKFYSFIKELIAEIENVVNLGKLIRQIRGKNPCRSHCFTGVLEKLLKEQSIFTSLNAVYCSLLQDQGKLTNSEYKECLAVTSHSNSSHIKPGGFTFQPTTAPPPQEPQVDQNVKVKESPSFNFEKVLNKHQSHRSPGSSKSNKKNIDPVILSHVPKRDSQLKTCNRLSCLACKAKLRQACEICKERDEKYQKQIDQAGNKHIGSLMKEIEKISEQTGFDPGVSVSKFNRSRISIKPLEGNFESFGAVADSQSIVLPLSNDCSPMSPVPKTANPFGYRTVPSPIQPLPHFKFIPTTLSYAVPVTHFTVPIPASKNNHAPSEIPANVTSSKRSLIRQKQKPISWTLKVSRYDLLKLRHELERGNVKNRMKKFTKEVSKQNSQSRRFLPISHQNFD